MGSLEFPELVDIQASLEEAAILDFLGLLVVQEHKEPLVLVDFPGKVDIVDSVDLLDFKDNLE